MSTTLHISVPDELLTVLGSKEKAESHLTRTAVLDLVKRQIISQGKGAELLQMSRSEFYEVMAESDIPMVDLSRAELVEGHQILKEALGDSE